MAVVSACLLWNPVLCNRIRADAAGTMGICGIFVLLPVLLVVIIDFTRRYLHHKKLEKQTSEIAVTMDKLSLPRGQMETDYQKMLRSLYITLQQQINELENGQVEQAEYFTMWVHQIKTPIAALRLLLAEEEDERSQEMWEELFSIEQYVEMALQFPDCLRKVRIL